MERISVTAYFSTIITHLNTWLRGPCRETGSRFLASVYRAVENPDKPFTLVPEYPRDGAHFNHDGYEVLGRTICSALKDIIQPGNRVLLIGDSITAGFPEYEPLFLGENFGDERHSFGYYLRTILGCNVVNKGISGDFTISMVRRIKDYFEPVPNFAILQGGANDAFYSVEERRGVPTKKMALDVAEGIFENFRTMVEVCRSHGAQVAIIPLLPFYG